GMHSDLFDRVVLPLRHKLFRFAFMLVNSRPEAEDIVQDAMMKLWIKKNDLSKIGNIEAWSMTITRNLAHDHLRKRKSRSSSGLLPEEIKTLAATEGTSLEFNEKLNHVHRCIDLLPGKQKQAVFLRDIEGHSYKEISDIMGIDENLVKVTLFRARDNLRKRILKIENYGL
ncbi:MAG TPA: RNA polymerase sigma factor, partial [Cyclobacteriaceae bacterium]|nr:RNA polymerase sigma factor [Cyclobacteriaceae bacterium]